MRPSSLVRLLSSFSRPVHIFLYEWATGGGLVEESGGIPASIAREGATMVGALASDLLRIPDCRVSLLRDMRVLDLNVPGCDVTDVLSRAAHWQEFARLAALADATIVIAPEFDKILLRTAQAVVRHGGKLISPAPDLIRVAADKQRTAEALELAGVPVPSSVLLDPDEKLPLEFVYPAVLKPIDGAGSQDIQLMTGPYDNPLPYHLPRRLERLCRGMAVSVAVLGGSAGVLTLPACRQQVSADGRLRYIGGMLPLTAGLAARAARLAERVVAALPPIVGYAGMDLILGDQPDGSEDVAIEVNPRLTTSYVGLRVATRQNLAEAIVSAALGELPALEFEARPLQFDTEGNVSYLDPLWDG